MAFSLTHKLPVRAQDQNGSQLMLMPLTGVSLFGSASQLMLQAQAAASSLKTEEDEKVCQLMLMMLMSGGDVSKLMLMMLGWVAFSLTHKLPVRA